MSRRVKCLGEDAMTDSRQVKKDQEYEFRPRAIEWDDLRTQRLWNYYSTSDAHRSTYFGETMGGHFVRVLRRRGVLRGRQKIVDISCGTGAIIEALLRTADRDCQVMGFDLSRLSVERTNARNRGSPGFAGAFPIVGYPTSLRDHSVDLLILTEVIEHLDDAQLQAVLGECRRVLAPDGMLVLTTPNEENLEREQVLCPDCGCIFHRWQHRRNWSVASLTGALLQAGFADVTVRPVTWGSELIHLAFTLLRRKHTGLLALAS